MSESARAASKIAQAALDGVGTEIADVIQAHRDLRTAIERLVCKAALIGYDLRANEGTAAPVVTQSAETETRREPIAPGMQVPVRFEGRGQEHIGDAVKMLADFMSTPAASDDGEYVIGGDVRAASSLTAEGARQAHGRAKTQGACRRLEMLLREEGRINGRDVARRVGFKYREFVFLDEDMLKVSIFADLQRDQARLAAERLRIDLDQIGILVRTFGDTVVEPEYAVFKAVVYDHRRQNEQKLINTIPRTIVIKTGFAGTAQIPDCVNPPIIQCQAR